MHCTGRAHAMTCYDSMGQHYNATRRADGRITRTIVSLLGCAAGATLADIGAGTGNYSQELAEHGFRVCALEPSETMIAHGARHESITWYAGCAEELPFRDDCFQGAMCILASHHFRSLEKGLVEIHRVLKKGARLVMFTQDPRAAGKACWFTDYFPACYGDACAKLPERYYMRRLAGSIFGTRATITDFSLPDDLSDRFFYSAWKYPERYLDAEFRRGISSFYALTEEETNAAMRRLESELADGSWDGKYGMLRTGTSFDGGYYFLSAVK
jgi:ubiquinone/menaquinone biosynthesis C-methylase UbiE